MMRKTITYGTFDLLHYGHLEILRKASLLGDNLVVGLSTDEFNKTIHLLEKSLNSTEQQARSSLLCWSKGDSLSSLIKITQ
mgnify:CR=1 FL=1